MANEKRQSLENATLCEGKQAVNSCIHEAWKRQSKPTVTEMERREKEEKTGDTDIFVSFWEVGASEKKMLQFVVSMVGKEEMYVFFFIINC